jgi:hypothetical protein
MEMEQKELDIAYKDGWAAAKVGKVICPFVLEPLVEAWENGRVAYKAFVAEERRNKRRKYIQRFNPTTKKWERYHKKSKTIVSTRKKRYCCQEGNW